MEIPKEVTWKCQKKIYFFQASTMKLPEKIGSTVNSKLLIILAKMFTA